MENYGIVKKMSEDKVGEEKFRELAKEVYPHITAIIEAMGKRGINGLGSLCVAADGYISFNVHESEWKMIRAIGFEAPTMEYNFRETVEL